MKCAIIERKHRAILDKLYKYFTYNNTYRYIDVLKKFDRNYNDTVHSATGMAPSKPTESDILTIWNKVRIRSSTKRRSVAKFQVKENVRISKGNLRFLSKGGEQYYTTEIFKIHKVVRKTPRPVSEIGIC